MPVHRSPLVTRGFHTVIGNRALWALGLAAPLVSGAGAGNLRVDGAGRLEIFHFDVTPAPEWTAMLVAGAVLLVAALFVLRGAVDVTLIVAADTGGRGAGRPLRAAWQAGRRCMWPIVALNLTFVVAVGLLGLGVAALTGLSGRELFAGSALAASAALPPADGLRVLSGLEAPVLGGLLLAAPAALALAIITQVAQRAAALERQSLGQAWGTGWRLLRRRPGPLVGLALAQLLAPSLAGGAALLVSGPLIALATVGLRMGAAVDTALAWGVAAILAPAIWLVIGAIGALPAAWTSTLWTLYYRAVTAPAPEPPARRAPYAASSERRAPAA